MTPLVDDLSPFEVAIAVFADGGALHEAQALLSGDTLAAFDRAFGLIGHLESVDFYDGFDDAMNELCITCLSAIEAEKKITELVQAATDEAARVSQQMKQTFAEASRCPP